MTSRPKNVALMRSRLSEQNRQYLDQMQGRMRLTDANPIWQMVVEMMVYIDSYRVDEIARLRDELAQKNDLRRIISEAVSDGVSNALLEASRKDHRFEKDNEKIVALAEKIDGLSNSLNALLEAHRKAQESAKPPSFLSRIFGQKES